MNRILIVGPRRPPFGGIEVYLKSLEAGLRQRGWAVEVIDVVPRSQDGTPRFHFFRKLLRFVVTVKLLLRSQSRVMHLLSSSYGALYANLLRAMVGYWSGKYVILSLLGGMAEVVIQGSSFKRRLLTYLFSHVDIVIACNSQIYHSVTELLGSSVQCELISNALPLDNGDPQVLPAVVESFIVAHPGTILCVGGPSSEYGLHTLVDALSAIRSQFPAIGVCFITRLPMKGAYAERVQQLVKSHNLEKMVIFIEKVEDIRTLMLRCTVLVRPTLTDGDSMSVREALLLGCPVIASDVAPRPGGCVVFRTGDHQHLADQLLQVLMNGPHKNRDAVELQIEGDENINRLIALYGDFEQRH